jgi:hypothetical protein
MDAPASWWLAKAYFSESSPPDIVVLGSSQLGPLLGADAYVYNRAIDATGDHRSYVLEHDFKGLLNKQWKVFVSAIPGAMISDQLIISRALFSSKHKPKLVAIALSPRDFIDNCFPSVNSTETFAVLAKYADSTSLNNALEKARTEKYRYLPVYNYDSESDSDKKSPLILGDPFERIHPGEIVICSGDGYSFKDNTDEYLLRYKNPLSPRFQLQLNYFEALLSLLAHQQIRVVVFDLPLTSSNKNLLPANFWSAYTQQISTICKKYDADLIEIDKDVKGFSDKEFMDSIHLNLVGGHRLASTLALYIANKFHYRTFAELESHEKEML